jgi:hypothetical protein
LNNFLKLDHEINIDEFKKNIIIARENKNVSIEEASRALNISKNIIVKLENGLLDEISNDIFILGHIKTYLNWIGIDPKLLITNRKIKNIDLKKDVDKIVPPYKFKLSRIYLCLLSVILFIIILIIYKNINTLEPINIQITKEEYNDLDISHNKEKIIIDNSEKSIEEKNKSNEINESKDTIKNEAQLETKEIDFIFIKAIADSWIEVENINSKIIVSKILKKAEEIKLPYEKDLILVTGNAGGIIIHINDKIINNIGASGEVKRNISLNFDNLIKFIDE